MAHSCDWLPTLAELCGVAPPETKLNGRSLVPVIRSGEAGSPHEVLHWRLGDQWAVRKGLWKLLHKPNDVADPNKLAETDKEWFLVNLETDPGEQTNLAAQFPEKVTELRGLEE
jgi:arylsulfatase A-like enzyme